MMEKIIDHMENSPINAQEAKTLRLLLKFSSIAFLASILIPSFTTSRFFILEKTYSITTGAFHLLNNGNFVLFLIIAIYFVIIPGINIAALWQATSENQSSNIGLFIAYAFHKYRWVSISLLLVLIGILEFGVVKKLHLAYGTYVYAGSILSVFLISNKTIKLFESAKMLNIEDLINEKIALAKNMIYGFLKSTAKVAVALLLLAIGINMAIKYISEPTSTRTKAVVGTAHISSLGTGTTPSDRDKDIYDAYSDINSRDPNFDVGKHCLEKERQGGVSFEECLSIAAAKIMSK